MSDKPHGPVGERFMRHHYGPSGYVKNGEGPEELGPQPAPGFHFDDRGVLVPDAAPPQPEAGLAALRAEYETAVTTGMAYAAEAAALRVERDRLREALSEIKATWEAHDSGAGMKIAGTAYAMRDIARRALGEEG